MTADLEDETFFGTKDHAHWPKRDLERHDHTLWEDWLTRVVVIDDVHVCELLARYGADLMPALNLLPSGICHTRMHSIEAGDSAGSLYIS